jgi:hypothetical protein
LAVTCGLQIEQAGDFMGANGTRVPIRREDILHARNRGRTPATVAVTNSSTFPASSLISSSPREFGGLLIKAAIRPWRSNLA